MVRKLAWDGATPGTPSRSHSHSRSHSCSHSQCCQTTQPQPQSQSQPTRCSSRLQQHGRVMDWCARRKTVGYQPAHCCRAWWVCVCPPATFVFVTVSIEGYVRKTRAKEANARAHHTHTCTHKEGGEYTCTSHTRTHTRTHARARAHAHTNNTGRGERNEILKKREAHAEKEGGTRVMG